MSLFSMLMPIGPLYFKEEIIGLFFKLFEARNSRVELAPPPHEFRTFSTVFLIGSHQDYIQRDRCFVSFFFFSLQIKVMCLRGGKG